MTRLACLLATLVSLVALTGPSTAGVKIGVLTDQTSAYADISGPGSVAATHMAVEDFGGSVLGQPIAMIAADTLNKSDTAAAIARQWYDQEGVSVIIDLPNSAVALAVQAIAREKGRISIVSGASVDSLTGAQCSPTGIHWTYDSYALGKVLGTGMAKEAGSTWFFITVDYTGGYALERTASAFIQAAGGKVLGSARHPLGTTDFSSQLLAAQASGAQVVVFADAGSDLINGVKQASEFKLAAQGQKLAAIAMFLSEAKALGPQVAQGLVYGTAFYWDMNDNARAFARRFQERTGRMPTEVQAGVYSATLHYLDAVKAAGTDDAMTVMSKMREMPINDMFATGGKLRVDGRMVHDMLLVQVKTPAESSGPWDLLKVIRVVPGNEAFRPLAEGGCPLVKK
jgi:branched-chain amino acid transport system substrate-binding protein